MKDPKLPPGTLVRFCTTSGMLFHADSNLSGNVIPGAEKLPWNPAPGAAIVRFPADQVVVLLEYVYRPDADWCDSKVLHPDHGILWVPHVFFVKVKL